MQQEKLVSLKNVNKYFNDTQVLFDINLDLFKGEVHALVGENGAGKSTLGKIIGGYYSLSDGQIDINGKGMVRWTPRDALSAGIAMMHQELSLVPELTVGENIFLGIESSNRFGVLQGNIRRRFDQLNTSCGFQLDVNAKVSSLKIADQQKVEIMRALSRDVQIVIMDEPTSSLSAKEAKQLHEIILRLKDSGCTIIYVSHFLDHVLEYTDRVTVLRDGHLIRTAFTNDESKASIVEAMLGHSSDVTFPKRIRYLPDHSVPSLEVRNLSTGTGVKDVSLQVFPGEIVGLFGLVGSGRTEIARAIYGADPVEGGDILLGGVLSHERTPSQSIRDGLVMIPEDRRKQGLVLTQDVKANITLGSLDKISIFGVLKKRQEAEEVKKLILQLGVVPADINGEVLHYSGGNQQKALFAKWLMAEPSILILDEPTRGVDVGAKRKIYELIVELAASGKAILLISSEFEEIIGLADRAYLLKDGETLGVLKVKGLTEASVLKKLFEVNEEHE